VRIANGEGQSVLSLGKGIAGGIGLTGKGAGGETPPKGTKKQKIENGIDDKGLGRI